MRDKTTNVLIIGAGPAGLYACDELLRSGVKDITLLDMGKPMVDRKCPQTKACNCKVCDILEGEGGAGGFSDGKKTYSLTRGTQMEELFDPVHESLLKVIDDRIVKFGVEGKTFDPLQEEPEEFKDSPFEFGSYPLRHIGSDGVRNFIINYGNHLREQGACTLYHTEAKRILVDDGKVVGIEVADVRTGEAYTIRAKYVMVASGLQGAPWLEEQMTVLKIKLGSGPAGIGLRVEADHEVLTPLFDRFYDFKLVYEHGNGMTFRSFCCNQRGHITNENHRTLGVKNVNGHSYLGEDMTTTSSNFAIICKLDSRHAKDPQAYVRDIARQVNDLTGGNTIIQRAKDFVLNTKTEDSELVGNKVRTNTQSTAGVNIGDAMPKEVFDGFRSFISELDQVVPGILREDTLIYAPEVKYYGRKYPVNFNTWECEKIEGLYILGNASGFLDSFVSAGLTGIIASRAIIKKEEE